MASSIILREANPRISNLIKPIGSRCLTFCPSDQGVCLTPPELISGIHWSKFSPITTPPACLDADLVCPYSLFTCVSICGYFFKNDFKLLQRTHRSAGFAVLKSLDIPVKKIEIKYVDNGEEFIVDLTDIYAFHGFDKFNTSVAIYESWYFYFLSRRDSEAINNLSDGTDYLESVDLVVTDDKDNIYESSCDDE